MIFVDSKVYSDGSHYIAIPPSSNPTRKRPKPPEEVVTVVEEETDVAEPEEGENTADFSNDTEVETDTTEKEEKPKQKKARQATRSELFDEFWTDAMELAKNRRHKFLMDKMRPYFDKECYLKDFVDRKTEAKTKNIIARKTRFIRKAYMNDFNYFFTFTYDDKKHTEASFKKSLLICLRNYSSRSGWKYMGVWERGGKTDRLHFHALVFVPDGTMPGEVVEVSDYVEKKHKRRISVQNTYFNERFGRCDVEEVYKGVQPYFKAIAYLLKYISKTNEKIIYSRNLPMYVISDVDDNDVICTYGLEDKKLLLFDNFICRTDGEVLGEMSEETKKRLRTSN